MIKMKKWMEQFRVEDWVVVWVSIPLLVLAAVAPSALPKVPATLLGGAAWSNIACLFAIVLVVLYAGCLDRKSTRQNSSHGVQSRMPSSA